MQFNQQTFFFTDSCAPGSAPGSELETEHLPVFSNLLPRQPQQGSKVNSGTFSNHGMHLPAANRLIYPLSWAASYWPPVLFGVASHRQTIHAPSRGVPVSAAAFLLVSTAQ